MKRVMAIATAAAALFLSLQVGSAQQPSSLRFNATTANDLRTWDQFVSAQERAGGLRVTQVEQDPSLPSRTVERMQQYYQGIPVWGAEVVRDSDGGVPVSIFGDVSAQLDLDTQPALTVDAATKVFLSSAAAATLLRPVSLVVFRQRAQPRLAYTTVVSSRNAVNHVFIDARSGAELLRYASIQTQEAVGTGRGAIGDTKKLSVLRQAGAYVADDQLRPPVLTTFDLRGNLTRALNVSFLGAPLFASDVASDSDNDWTDPPVVDAHAYVGWTYDYYFKRHGRRGLDNRDRPLIVIANPVTQQGALTLASRPVLQLRCQCVLVRRLWPRSHRCHVLWQRHPVRLHAARARPSPRSSGSLDIVAHELTHGVTSSSSNLIYMDESGALNEAFSDIMGIATEFFFQPVGRGNRAG